VHTVAGHPNQLTYTDTNAGASTLATINNAGAVDLTLTGTVIAEANAGVDTIATKNFGDVGLRGISFAPVAATSVTLAQSPANPLNPGTPVTLTATLSNPQVASLTGDTVAFINVNTNTVLGIVQINGSNQAILTLPSGVAGNVNIQAYFAGGGTQALASARSNTIQVLEAGDQDTLTVASSSPSGAS